MKLGYSVKSLINNYSFISYFKVHLFNSINNAKFWTTKILDGVLNKKRFTQISWKENWKKKKNPFSKQARQF